MIPWKIWKLIPTIISGCVDSSTALAVSCKFWHSTLSSFHFEFKVPAVQIFFEFKGRLPSIIFGLAVPLSHGDPLVQSFSAKPTRCAALSAARMGKRWGAWSPVKYPSRKVEGRQALSYQGLLLLQGFIRHFDSFCIQNDIRSSSIPSDFRCAPKAPQRE